MNSIAHHKWIAAAALLLIASTCAAQTPLVCRPTTGVPIPTLRSEGLAERVSDVIITCSGGVTPPAGQTLPSVDITVFLNTDVTSRLQNSTIGSEALLIIDEPNSGLPGYVPATQLACASYTGCPIVSNGATPYDGSPGHPNVFQGVVGGAAVTFFGVPLAAPGNYGIINAAPNGVRVLRITNLRVNASDLVPNPSGIPFPVVASISASSSSFTLPIYNVPDLPVGYASSGLIYQTHVFGSTAPANSLDLSTCIAGQYCLAGYLQFQEGFNTAFKIRLLGAGQNIPGPVYNTESGFYSPGLAASNPDLAAAGLADAATRLKADFQGVPPGAQLWVDLNSLNTVSTAGAALTASESGPFSPVAAAGSIGGIPAAPLTVTNGTASAVWEINNVNQAQIDTAQFPVWVYFPPASTPSGSLTVKGSFAPNPDDGAFPGDVSASAANATYPVPRFASAKLSVTFLTPNSAIAGGPSFSLAVNGIQFVPGSEVDWNGLPLTTNFVNSSRLTAFVPASLISAIPTNQIFQTGTAAITVANPGGLTSAPSTFTILSLPEAVSVTPSASAGSTQIFTFQYSDASGAGELASVQAMINGSQTNAGGCYVSVIPATGAISLAADSGNSWSQMILGTTGILQNSQCSINVGQSAGLNAGSAGYPFFYQGPAGRDGYTLDLAITFHSGFTGIKNIYGYAQDWAGFSSGWQRLGTWSESAMVQSVSVTPSFGSGPSQRFAFQFSDAAGAQDFLQANVVIGSSSGTSGACTVNFTRANGALALLTDSGALPASTILLGSGSQQNSQCILIGSGSSATVSGTTLTLNLSIAFQPAFAGAKNIYANAVSSDGNAGMQQLGIWNATAPTALRFVPVTPCRVADTRNAASPFGGPSIAGGTTRDFNIPNSACGIPSTAQAYSLNVAVAPAGPLGFITLWPAGQTQPLTATLNSLDGRIKSNAAIIPAGTGGAISVFASNTTNVVLDINGYFVPATDPTALAFFPVTPCRIADTRQATPMFGASLVGGQSRTFPVLAGPCNIPATARAYSLSLAAVPSGPLGFLTAWPTGQAQPGASSLNALTGAVTANAAIVPAGAGGSIDIFASNGANLVIDINGYFAPMGTGGLSLYTTTPCRALDTRQPAGSPPFSGLLNTPIAGPCGIPMAAQAYVMNATVVPAGALGFLTLWPQSQSQPTVSTLNALDGAVTSNLAIVPTGNGNVSAFASNQTHLLLDILGYLAP